MAERVVAVEREAARVANLYHSARRAGLRESDAVRTTVYVATHRDAALLIRCAELIARMERAIKEVSV